MMMSQSQASLYQSSTQKILKARATNARMVEMRANLSWHAREPIWRLGSRFWIVTGATSARIEEPSMVSILCIKLSVPDTYK